MTNVTRVVASGFLLAGVALGASLFTAGCGDEVVVYRDRPEMYQPAPPPPPPQPVVYQPVAYEPPPAPVVTVYDQGLSPYGHWVVTRDYGRCWAPDGRPAGWQPYTIGHWVQSQYGWMWVADGDEAPWGAITYHYGRWNFDASYGWVWVPATTWGPAWVSWREGGEYCGWHTLPPQCGVGDTVVVAQVDFFVPATRYVFVDERYMAEPRVYDHFEHDNVTIINRTTNITNITMVNDHVVARGVAVERIEHYSGHSIATAQIQEVTTQEQIMSFHNSGQPVIYRPAAVVAADADYRQRVDRRVSDADVAQKHRANVRAEDAGAAAEAEKHRANDRTADQQAADEAERARVARRAAAAADAEKQRANDRAQQEAADQSHGHHAAPGEQPSIDSPADAHANHAAPGDHPTDAPDDTHGHHHAAPGDQPAADAPAETHGHHAAPSEEPSMASPADAHANHAAPGDHATDTPDETHGHHHATTNPADSGK